MVKTKFGYFLWLQVKTTQVPSRQVTWKCTDPCREATFLLERGVVHFHVSWCKGKWRTTMVKTHTSPGYKSPVGWFGGGCPFCGLAGKPKGHQNCPDDSRSRFARRAGVGVSAPRLAAAEGRAEGLDRGAGARSTKLSLFGVGFCSGKPKRKARHVVRSPKQLHRMAIKERLAMRGKLHVQRQRCSLKNLRLGFPLTKPC